MLDPAERRRAKRYETSLRGRIGPVGGRQRNCLLQDYCSGGMLVRLLQPDPDNAAAPFRSGESVHLNTELLTPGGSRPLRISATLAWVKEEHVGLSFPKTSQAIVDALQHHDRLSGAGTAGARVGSDGGEARSLARLRHLARGALPDLLVTLLARTDARLLEATATVASNTEQQKIFGDMCSLANLAQGEAMARQILSMPLEQQAQEAAATEAGDGALSLVEPDDFERWLEASRVLSLLEERFDGQLDAIRSRLSRLHENGSSDGLALPLEPQHFTRALQAIAKKYDLCPTSRSVLFDCTAEVLKEHLGKFYAAVDGALNAMGAPAARTNTKVTVMRPSLSPRRGNLDQPPPEHGRGGTAASPAGALTGGPAGAPGTSGTAGSVVLDPTRFRAVQAREAQQRESLAQEMLAQVTDAPDITDSLANWLQQLSAPLIGEAIADQTFFQNDRHPLREIIDSLGRLQQFRPSPDANPAHDPIRQRVSELLEPVAAGAADQQTLHAIATTIDDLAGDRGRLYQRNLERVAQGCEGRDRVRRGRAAVVAEINRRYADRRVPEVVPELLDVGWRAVLELAWLNSTQDNNQFGRYLALLDGVVAVLGGEAFEQEPQSSGRDKQQLLTSIEQELTAVAFEPIRRNLVVSRLRREMLDAASDEAPLVAFPPLQHTSDEVSSNAPPDGVSEYIWTQMLTRCKAVQVGDRTRLLDSAGGQRVLRIAWISSDHERFTLVDHLGLRVRDLTLAELALGAHQRRIEFDHSDDRPLSERAVEEMLTRMEAQLAHQAAHDSLTGLINRQQFNAALERALATADRPADRGILLLADIDQFRLVNDIYGYDTGDRLLVALARLLEQVDGAGVLGHLGGDHFALLLADSSLAEGEQRAQLICESFRTMPFEWSGQAIGLSMSIGVTGMPGPRDDFSQLLQTADSALAAAKAAGGNSVYVYRDADPVIERRKESMRWVVQVDEALDHGQLRLRCQPIVPIRPDQGLAPHYEVLLGVDNGAAEPLPIAEFIEAAERYNRMRAIDRWVAGTTMDWIAAHRDQMPDLHGFAVNLSGQTASDPGFVDFVRRQFQRTGIDPAWLSFEVTETAAIADLSHSAGIILDLKALGCKVALDDFGSGLASYSYLKELPVDWLKIDGVFVRKIAASREDHAVVKSINEIGHFLGKKTIAEYVADDEILRLVGEIGVDYAQGFGISPPFLMTDLLPA